jgi:hypothetical protein
MNNNAIRWALVTFASDICIGTVGHYVGNELAFLAIVLLSVGFSVAGAVAIDAAKLID